MKPAYISTSGSASQVASLGVESRADAQKLTEAVQELGLRIWGLVFRFPEVFGVRVPQGGVEDSQKSRGAQRCRFFGGSDFHT